MGQLFLKKPMQAAIREGRKRTTIRRWKAGRPGVRAGQRVYSPGLGWLSIESVEAVDLDTLRDEDARADGFDTAAGCGPCWRRSISISRGTGRSGSASTSGSRG